MPDINLSAEYGDKDILACTDEILSHLSDREYIDGMARIGCAVCRRPAMIHHIRKGMGMGQRNTNRRIVPLCPEHHNMPMEYGVAFHAGKRAFERNFGSEEFLERQSKQALAHYVVHGYI